MAQRFGGAHSPGGPPPGTSSARKKHPFEGRKPARAAVRTKVLFIVPLHYAIHAFRSDATDMAMYLVAMGVLLGGAWLTREGVRAQEAYEARTIARRPAVPRKILGSVLTGLGLGVAGLVGHGVVEAVIFAVLGAGLHLFAFGPDPLRDKGAEGIDMFQQDRVARVVDEAEEHLAAMSDAILRARDRHLSDRVAQFQVTVRDMFRTVEQDPRDLTAARKYLGVYLLGAKDATVKFADLYARTQDQGARADYEALLGDLESNFAAKTQTLLLDDRSDLDVEIEVLRDRLAREGVRP
jgi:hypothetical protein